MSFSPPPLKTNNKTKQKQQHGSKKSSKYLTAFLKETYRVYLINSYGCGLIHTTERIYMCTKIYWLAVAMSNHNHFLL